MTRILKAIPFCILVAAVMACSLINTLTGSGPDMIRANEMWSDVPKMDSFTKSDLELPVTVKLLMRTALNNLWRFSNSSEPAATPVQGDWIVFVTKQTPAEIQSFYSAGRMSGNGWEAKEGSTCKDGTDQGVGGAFCVFEKREGDKVTALMIMALNDDEKKEANVFFLRLEGDKSSFGTPAKK